MTIRIACLLLVLALPGCGRDPGADPPSLQGAAAEATTYVYRCDSQHMVRVSYPTLDRATVEIDGKTLQMKIAVSASGARYVGDGMQWWSKGSGPGSPGSLFRHDGSDADSGPPIETCKQVSTG